MTPLWESPPGPYVTDEILPSADMNTGFNNNESVLEYAIGIYGAAGARFVSVGGTLPPAGTAVQWLVQAQGFNNFTAGQNTTDFPGVPITYLTFPNPFPATGGVAYVECEMRYGYDSGGHTLTYTPNVSAHVLNDSISTTHFGVFVWNENTQAIASSGAYSCSYWSLGWVPIP